ncbi:NAD(P)-dependent dehydrogenase (short-subunit alcohol dehydrogenase family) [Croceicoccus naphthovorans]|nr:NAD(P)-dependent dehydrogenase (short-subunit alcohol dehydrogenase family) [Croceicoccus naphthovorans]
MARRFADSGWHVIVHYHSSSTDADRLADTLESAETVGFDISDLSAIEKTVKRLAGALLEWCVLINCAAVFEPDTAHAIDPDVFDTAIRTNAEGPVALAQAFLAQAQSDRGRCVINVLDQKLANMNPDFFSYTMAKAALANATQMLAMAHVGSDDRIYGLAPGAMLPSHDQVAHEHEISGRMNLLHRLTRPDELSEAALFLASGALESGQTIYVDSGQHLMSQPRDVLHLARGES